jgi:hypothetical protein
MPHTFLTLIRFPVQELGEADVGKAVIIKSTAISGTGLFIAPSRVPVASLFRQLRQLTRSRARTGRDEAAHGNRLDADVSQEEGGRSGSIVAKRKMGMYREGCPDWLKIKNRTYSQAEGRHELLTRKTGGRRRG